ncbi:single-stranded DNA-binding protein [Acrasis kona]|uniref:Single-stranded DNA-binding protein n=1 Tax=Acrasis kona TaxID=1008807 RepID=A0AAW2ZI57_9EUKA
MLARCIQGSKSLRILSKPILSSTINVSAIKTSTINRCFSKTILKQNEVEEETENREEEEDKSSPNLRNTVNKITLCGRITRSPTVLNDKVVFSVTTQFGKDKPEIHDCIWFGTEKANSFKDLLKKDQLVFVEGRLKTSAYIDKNGLPHKRTSVVIRKFADVVVLADK